MPASTAPARPRPPAPGEHWALFLDVDGCLLDFADAPDAVVVAPGLVDGLAVLSDRLHGALALVSGRSLATLDRLFAPLRLPAAGLHGLERRSTTGLLDAPLPAPLLRITRVQAERIAAAHPGAVVEDKGAALALHWRAAPDAATALQALAHSALPWLPGYCLQPGDQVIELRPAHMDKGDAIAALLEHPPFRGRVPVFAGDDFTDEHGFDVINARDGISVLVGARENSTARYGLSDPAAVRAWLGVADRGTHTGGLH